MDIRTGLAAANYAVLSSPSATKPDAETGTSPARMAGAFAETLQRAETLAQDAMVGRATPHSLVQALAESQLAVETAVTVRDRVVEAYQEILRMPV